MIHPPNSSLNVALGVVVLQEEAGDLAILVILLSDFFVVLSEIAHTSGLLPYASDARMAILFSALSWLLGFRFEDGAGVLSGLSSYA